MSMNIETIEKLQEILFGIAQNDRDNKTRLEAIKLYSQLNMDRAKIAEVMEKAAALQAKRKEGK